MVEESPTIGIPPSPDYDPAPVTVPDPGGWLQPKPAEPAGGVVPRPAQPVESEPAESLLRVEPLPAELLEPELVEQMPRVEPVPAELPEPSPRQRGSRLKSSTRKGRTDELPSSEPALDEPEEELHAQPNRLWIRALDLARRYDFLGLDRVPVNESLRGQEHQHTWDHRVAPSSGPGKYICTICGEIRR
jgi:hypothetical protein